MVMRILPPFPLKPLADLLNSLVDFPVIVSLFRNPNRSSSFTSFHSLRNSVEIDLQNDLALYDELVSFNKFVQFQPLPSIKDFCKLLTRIVKMHHYSVVISLIQRLDVLGVKSDIYAVNIAINCFCHLNRVDYGLSVFGKALKRGYEPDCATFNTLIRGLCADGMLDHALQLFDQMLESGFKPNDVTYGTMIYGMCKSGNTSDAIILLRKIDEESKRVRSPGIIVYSTIIDTLCKKGKVIHALNLFSEMIQKGVMPNVVTYMCLMQGLCGFGLREEANRLLDDMIGRNISPDLQTINLLEDPKNYGSLKNLDNIKDAILTNQMESLQKIMLSMNKTLEELSSVVYSLAKTLRDAKQQVKGGSVQPSVKQLHQRIGIKPSIVDCLEGLRLLHEMYQSEYLLKSSLISALASITLKPRHLRFPGTILILQSIYDVIFAEEI
ncbi:Pentatricopeptide repeat-containing protein [Cynara cardunculus var. scolymus]|uniref:Pentatricopeptide repeat-containing protein n=1 Tax=Cynara cardunculus var. scolymus TaxID=59895 RepID=A0A124SGU2_CYNCS|nr:Pentatricopeptide repeat-containing protein [Cynara cardunculus var. scolymus]